MPFDFIDPEARARESRQSPVSKERVSGERVDEEGEKMHLKPRTENSSISNGRQLARSFIPSSRLPTLVAVLGSALLIGSAVLKAATPILADRLELMPKFAKPSAPRHWSPISEPPQQSAPLADSCASSRRIAFSESSSDCFAPPSCPAKARVSHVLV